MSETRPDGDDDAREIAAATEAIFRVLKLRFGNDLKITVLTARPQPQDGEGAHALMITNDCRENCAKNWVINAARFVAAEDAVPKGARH